MIQFFKVLSFAVLPFLISSNSYGQQKRDYQVKIDSLLQTTSPRSFNGIIWITKKGEAKYLKTYGYSNFETKTPFTLKDNFRIQSMSKQITAAVFASMSFLVFLISTVGATPLSSKMTLLVS